MNLTYKTRKFYPEELRLLKTLKAQKEKQKVSKIKIVHFFIAGFFGVSLTYITTIIPDSFWTFLFGTLAVCSFCFIVFAPFEIYKMKRKQKVFIQNLNSLIDRGTVDTCHIETKKIALAPEFEDESDLYIVELNDNEVLYLWDNEYNLNKKFPCLEFEIYEDDFFKLFGRLVYPLSNKIQPVKIDKKAKWNFMKEYGVLGNLEIEKINFEKLMEKYNSCA